MSKAFFTVSLQLDKWFVCITGPNITVWEGDEEDALFHGTMDECEIKHPEVIQALIQIGAVKRVLH